MHTPKIGELVKIVADTCGHGLRGGTLIIIQGPHSEGKWLVRGKNLYITDADIVALPKGMRKTMRIFDKAVRRELAEIPQDTSGRSAVLLYVLNNLTDEVAKGQV